MGYCPSQEANAEDQGSIAKLIVRLSGARGPKLEEPLGWVITYPIQWRDPRVDLAELAKLRWIESWSREALAKRYGKSVDAIQCYFQHLKRKDFLNVGLTSKEVKPIKKTISK